MNSNYNYQNYRTAAQAKAMRTKNLQLKPKEKEKGGKQIMQEKGTHTNKPTTTKLKNTRPRI